VTIEGEEFTITPDKADALKKAMPPQEAETDRLLGEIEKRRPKPGPPSGDSTAPTTSTTSTPATTATSSAAHPHPHR